MDNLFIAGVEFFWDRLEQDFYLQEIPVFRKIHALSFHRPITIFTGENGTGKSTLLEGIAVNYGYNPEGGSQNYMFSTHDTHSELYKVLRLIKRRSGKALHGFFLRAETFYNFASEEEELAKSVGFPSAGYHEMSHGESFLSVAQSYMDNNGIYFLDEPEAALSPQRQLTLLAEIYQCSIRGAQFFMATHSPILLGIPGAEILSFDGDRIHKVEYEETGSYQVTSLFLQRREQMLQELLREDD